MFYKKLAKLLLASGLMLTVAVGTNTIEAKADKVVPKVNYSDLSLTLTTTEDDKDAEYFYVGVKTTGDVKAWDRIQGTEVYGYRPYQSKAYGKNDDGELIYLKQVDLTSNSVVVEKNGNAINNAKKNENDKLLEVKIKTDNSGGFTNTDLYLDGEGNVIDSEGYIIAIQADKILDKRTDEVITINIGDRNQRYEVVAKETIVDISSYVSPTKGYKIEFYSDADSTAANRAEVTIANQSKKIKATYTPTATTGTKVKVDADAELKGDAFQFKPLYAEKWIDGSELESEDSAFYSEYEMTMLDYYSLYGTTLLVREAPVVEVKKDKDGNVISVESKKMVSKEAKLKIPKSANGPKLAIDVNKLTVALPAGSSWRLISSSGDVLTDGWVSESGKKSLTIKDMKGKLADDYKNVELLNGTVSLEAKVNAKGKKADSKISFLNLPAQANGSTLIDGKIKIEYVKKTNSKTKEETVSQIKITNNTEGDIQIAEKTTAADANKETPTKLVTIKKGATKPYAATKLADKTNLAIRTAGIKATKTNPNVTLASTFTDLTITYPAKPSKIEGVTVSAGVKAKEVFVKLTKKPGYTYKYEIKGEEVKDTDFKLDEAEKGTAFTESSIHDNLIATGAEKDKYIVVYEISDGIIRGYSSVKIVDDMLVAEDSTAIDNSKLTSLSKTGTSVFDTADPTKNKFSIQGFNSSYIYKYKIVDINTEKLYTNITKDILEKVYGFKAVTLNSNQLNLTGAEVVKDKYVLVVCFNDTEGATDPITYQYIQITE